MLHRNRAICRALVTLQSIAACAAAGCGIDTWLEDVLNGSAFALRSPNNFVEPSAGSGSVRPAGPFGSMVEVALGDNAPTRFRGTLAGPSDYVVYDIGIIAVGDRITASVEADSRGLDPAVGVFDQDQSCLYINDDRLLGGRDLSGYADFISRRGTAHGYVVVSASPKSDSAGDYSLIVTRASDADVPDARRQLVYLTFDGAQGIRIADRAPIDVPPFSGDRIGPAFADHTDEIIEKTVARVRRDFFGLDVSILSSSEQEPPKGHHSTVYMGAADDALLGVADGVDPYNAVKVQKAMVFVDTFSVFSKVRPSVQEIANALANVTSHEIGHLLGLQHTWDPDGIMDVSATLRQMLVPQTFRRSGLDPLTFAVGYQDAPLSMLEAVGGEPSLIRAARILRDTEPRDSWYDLDPDPTPVRMQVRFGSCCSTQISSTAIE